MLVYASIFISNLVFVISLINGCRSSPGHAVCVGVNSTLTHLFSNAIGKVI